jgi:serine/threonine-protein kinase
MSESRTAGTSAARTEQGSPASSSKGESDPLIGRTVNGRFKIMSVIARGGMGKVYKAEQSPLGRICALKVLSPKYEGDRDPEFHKRFFLEAATAARLSHPNTVTVFDYGQSDDDIYYIAMEYIEGRTLHRTLRDEGPMQEARVAYIASQICRSLREAHGLGVVHRDLKPGNILLCDRGDERDNVKVLDFGLVKDVSGTAEDLTQAGLFMGSPKYMAPEQILGGEITPRTDIYSLGVMLYEMLTGKVPFDRGASVGTLMAHVNDRAASMRSVNPHIAPSPTMEAIVYRCLEKEPSKRFASMKDLLNALKGIAGANGSTAADTNESMPIARADVQPGSTRTAETYSGSLLQTDSSGQHLRPPGSPDLRYASASVPDSVTGLGSAPHADTGSLTHQRTKGRAYMWVMAAAVAIGITAAVVLTSKRAPSPELPTSPATPASTGTSVASAPAHIPSAVADTPSVRTIRVESEPPGAGVSDNGTEVCMATPCEIVWKGDAVKAEHKLSLTKRGYRTAKISVSATDEKVSTRLEIIPVSYSRPAPGGGSKNSDVKGAKPNPYGD